MAFNHKEVYDWYKLPAVKFEIIKFLKNREMCIINKEVSAKTVRMLKCHSVQHFDFINNTMIKVEEQNTLYNYYYSLARYIRGIPDQSPNLKERDNSKWTAEHHFEMEAYDLLIDIDGEFEYMDSAFDSAKEIKAFFDKCNMPYELRFSGCGFHFIVPYELIGVGFSLNPKDENNVYNLYYKIARFLFDNYSEMVDFSIYDSRRITKIPYSIAIYNEGNFMCYPFISELDFNEFNLDRMRISNIDKNLIRGRGVKLFNSQGNAYDLLKNIKDRGGFNG
ncbi:MAG TPA: hypothetical protein VMV86_06280 [Methanosarcinales archaeon]|nr:hypothetical protein [Methanosarcinales archaeon]